MPISSHLLSLITPEGIFGLSVVGGGDPGVVGSGPEPAVDVDGLEGGGLATLAREIALPAGGVDGRNIV